MDGDLGKVTSRQQIREAGRHHACRRRVGQWIPPRSPRVEGDPIARRTSKGFKNPGPAAPIPGRRLFQAGRGRPHPRSTSTRVSTLAWEDGKLVEGQEKSTADPPPPPPIATAKLTRCRKIMPAFTITSGDGYWGSSVIAGARQAGRRKNGTGGGAGGSSQVRADR